MSARNRFLDPTARVILLGLVSYLTIASADTITVSDAGSDGKKVTITVVAPASLPIASVHVDAPASGNTLGVTSGEPAGWTFGGFSSTAAGDAYSWTNPANVSGTLVFSITDNGAGGLLTLPSNIRLDYLTEKDGQTVREFYDPSLITPEPTAYWLTGSGMAVLLALGRRLRRPRSGSPGTARFE